MVSAYGAQSIGECWSTGALDCLDKVVFRPMVGIQQEMLVRTQLIGPQTAQPVMISVWVRSGFEVVVNFPVFVTFSLLFGCVLLCSTLPVSVPEPGL